MSLYAKYINVIKISSLVILMKKSGDFTLLLPRKPFIYIYITVITKSTLFHFYISVTELKPLPSYSSLYTSHGGHSNGGANDSSSLGSHTSSICQSNSAVLAALASPTVSHHATLLPISSLTPSGRQILASNSMAHMSSAHPSEAHPSVIGRTFSLDGIIVKQEQDAVYTPSPPKAVPVMTSDGSNDDDVTVHGLTGSEILQLKSSTVSL